MTFNEHETRAVLETFEAIGRSTEADDGHSFVRLGIHGGQEVILVVSGQGRKAAQKAATRAIEYHRPQALIAVGIAFGIQSGKRNIGDVLVSEYLCDYESVRLNKDGSRTQRGPRPPASTWLLDTLRVLIHRCGDRDDWPHVLVGPVVCGDKLVDDPTFLDYLKSVEPEAIGGEMEGAGIEAAARGAKVDWLVVKGISDWGDGNKGAASKPTDQKTAAMNAAQVARALVEAMSRPVAPLGEPRVEYARPQRIGRLGGECHPPKAAAMGLVDLRDVPEASIEGAALGLLARLDGNSPAASAEAHRDGREVLPYLREWLALPGVPLFALLGEYGMSKTISSQLLARRLDEERAGDPTRPIPLYFDLRHVTGLRARVPTLAEALEECMQRGWLDEGAGSGYTLANVHRWIAQGAVVFFDGLDEVLVKLTEADGKVFTNNLLKLIADARARARAEGRTPRLKVLVTCRTQYFPTLQAQNSHFTQADRGEFDAESYRAMVLLPWSEAQVHRYLARALPEMDTERLIDMVKSVHNLEELTQRPYTLKLVAGFIPEIEHARAAGRSVYGVTLYRKMAEKWLSRDDGKHHIRPEHKLRLAAHLAAHLWRSGRNAMPANDLHAWFHEFLDSETDLRRRYATLHPDQLEEDLRTATFLARQDDGEGSAFRFAHTSLLEFFLAAYLFDAARRGEPAAWAVPVPSDETLDFLGQMFAEAGTAEATAALTVWRTAYRRQTSELLLAYALRARRKGWPTPLLRGIDLTGAQLRSWQIGDDAGAPLDLTDAKLAGADLRDSMFRNTNLDNASFEGARMERSNVLDCSCRNGNFRQAEITATIFRNCDLAGADWHEAAGYRPQWLLCRPAPALPKASQTLRAPQYAPATVSPDSSDAVLAWLSGGDLPKTACAFAPQADAAGRQWLASAGTDGTVRLWDAATGACLRITALCRGDGFFHGGYAVWEPATQRIVEVAGEAWRHLAWLRPLPNALPERLPLEAFGPVPMRAA